MSPRNDLLPGTLELLILKTLSSGAMHGYGIAQQIERVSDLVLRIEEGSLYPALQRLDLKGWVTSEWRVTPTKRRARYYSISRTGEKRLREEIAGFDRAVGAIRRVLRPGEA